MTMHNSKDIPDLKERALFIRVSDLARTAGCSETISNVNIGLNWIPMLTWRVDS